MRFGLGSRATGRYALEFDLDQPTVARRVRELADLHRNADGLLTALHQATPDRTRSFQYVRAGGLAEWLRRYMTSQTGGALPDFGLHSGEVASAIREIQQMDKVMASQAPDYTAHARLDYSVFRVAAMRFPDAGILLGITDLLEKAAPRGHRPVYQFHRADLLAFMGQDEEAYAAWSSCVDVVAPTQQFVRALRQWTHRSRSDRCCRPDGIRAGRSGF